MNSFCFIMEGLEVKGETPLEIIPGHLFRKANSKEITVIKKFLSEYGISIAPYEANAEPTSDHGHQYAYDLPKNNWRYWVIAFEGSHINIREIEYAVDLLKHDMNIAFTDFSEKGEKHYTGSMYTPSILYAFIGNRHIGPGVLSVEADELLEIGNNYDLIFNVIKDSYPNIYKSINDFHFAKNIPKISSLLVVAYFSIIESIITHKPKPEDTIDSITRQIKTKMYLLGKRFERNMDYEAYFNQANSDTVWQKLYSYRSSVAHGDNITFDREFEILKDKDNVHAFLKETIKLLLLYAIKNPDFILDLSKC